MSGALQTGKATEMPFTAGVVALVSPRARRGGDFVQPLLRQGSAAKVLEKLQARGPDLSADPDPDWRPSLQTLVRPLGRDAPQRAEPPGGGAGTWLLSPGGSPGKELALPP